MATDKKEKDLLSLCGEYAVASELCKHGFNASITYGNAKAVDICVFDNKTSRYRRIEVKTSKSSRLVTGFFQKYDIDSDTHPDYWILVMIDRDNHNHFYVMTHEEMGNAQMKRNGMSEWHKVKGGVDNIRLCDIEMYEDQFDKITFDE